MNILLIVVIIILSFIILIFSSFTKRERAETLREDFKSATLSNMVYPAIKGCVQNRYLILIGFFAYYAFISVNDDRVLSLFSIGFKEINFVVSLLFFAAVIHNLINYLFNYMDQIILESKNGQPPNFWCVLWESKMEWVFSLVMVILIIGAFSLIK